MAVRQLSLDLLAHWRAALLADVRGTVLELGARRGPNFRHYAPDARVVATDIDAAALSDAVRLSRAAHSSVRFGVADAQCLPFAPASFDAVIATLVFCSIPDPQRALAEVARVLRPGGRLYTIDHVRSETPLLGWLMDALTPAWSRIADGCHLNRRTEQMLQRSGFTIVKRRQALAGVLRWLVADAPAQTEGIGGEYRENGTQNLERQMPLLPANRREERDY